MQKTLGGDRLGSGNRMKVDLHGYERSTHDLGYLWRSTIAPGTLVPFLKKLALPGDTFDIDLNCDIKTHPTVGPLFGSYKVQLDIFVAPLRLYQGLLHNNKLKIGMNMANVKLPIIKLNTVTQTTIDENTDIDNASINPSCILSYLGIRGAGLITTGTTPRAFNGVPLLAYWDIFKNYYANKQEELATVIHTPREAIVGFTDIDVIDPDGVTTTALPQAPSTTSIVATTGTRIRINYTALDPTPEPDQILINTTMGQIPLSLLCTNFTDDNAAGELTGDFDDSHGDRTLINYSLVSIVDPSPKPPSISTFPLANLDEMRERVLSAATSGATAFDINLQDLEPYSLVLGSTAGFNHMLGNQEGLALKTYQSDLFNNWLNTEWIDGTGGIAEVTAIDTSGGSFTIDQLVLSKKIYNMLNRIAVSGGSYDDWQDAVWAHDRYVRPEIPSYVGGLIKELVFQEVVSNSESNAGGVTQPLGTLAGKGVMSNKHKGGRTTVKVDEPSYIMGLVSLTPRVDYSQGNDFDVHLKTMDDLHKPALDEIGFQELITEQMAWWDTTSNDGINWPQNSAGKQPAWVNYMTSVNKTFGNFAIKDNEMFMTLNRRYEANVSASINIKDLTTYIDPVKYNFIFAQTSLDAQNFWVQIAVDITARRKMSAKIMPNL